MIFLPGESKKRAKLIEELHRAPRPVIVFVNAKSQSDVIGRDLEERGFSACVLHGGKAQEEREAALADFKAGMYEILVATDGACAPPPLSRACSHACPAPRPCSGGARPRHP